MRDLFTLKTNLTTPGNALPGLHELSDGSTFTG